MNACTNIVGAGDDFFRNIPDDIISQILSRTPLMDAVRTSMLSKDWKYKWTSLYKLDIHDAHWEANHQGFIDFLNTTLPSLKCLRIFRFRYTTSAIANGNDYQRWFSAVLEHNLEIFMVVISTLAGPVLPGSLLNSSSLRILRFSASKSTLKVDVKNNIALNLTHLQLTSVKIVSSSPSVTFTFPVLETLTLTNHQWLNVESVEIHAPSLTALMSSPSSSSSMEKDYDYSIVVVAPRISLFDCRGILEKITVRPSRSSVVSAYLLGVFPPSYQPYLRRQVGYRCRKLLNTCNNLEELFIQSTLLKESVALPLSRHYKLTRMTFDLMGNPKLLLELLHAAPSLKFLCVYTGSWRRRHAYNYEALESVPACIESHLEEVVVINFFGMPSEYDLVKFLFKNAMQLKKFCIYLLEPRALKEKEKTIQRLSTIPRCSASLTIHVDFYGYNDGRWNHILYRELLR